MSGAVLASLIRYGIAAGAGTGSTDIIDACDTRAPVPCFLHRWLVERINIGQMRHNHYF
jgi:hypothetical protein